MKHTLKLNPIGHSILVAMALTSLLLSACGGDSPVGVADDKNQSHALIIAPSCGGSAAGRSLGEAVVTPECLEWTYADGRLRLTHTNAVYNCCLDSMAIDMQVGEPTIAVVETEYLAGGMGCRCVCRYDLDYRVPGLPPGQYNLRLFSYNSYGGGVELLFELSIDLVSTPTGRYCIDSDNY